MPVKQPKTVYRGEALPILITATRRSNGARINLDDETTEMELEIAAKTGGEVIIALSYGEGITKLDQAEPDTMGQAEIEISSEQNDIAPGIYKYDVALTMVGGERRFIVPPSDYVIRGVVNQLVDPLPPDPDPPEEP